MKYLIWLIAITVLFSSQSLTADSCAQPYSDVILQPGTQSVRVNILNLNSSMTTALSTAINGWNSCSGGTNMTQTGTGDITVTLRYHDRPNNIEGQCGSTSACACFD
jgi:hypothetical protein